MYQHFFQTADADVGQYLKLFTFCSLEEISALEAEHAAAPGMHFAQKRLAEEVTKITHGEAGLAHAVAISRC